MDGCGHCKNAKKELASEISSGKVKVISPKEAQTVFTQKLSGFPAFKNMENGKETVGFRSKEDLMKILEYRDSHVASSSGGDATIVFYHMAGCPYCKKADELLKKEIESGKISVQPHTSAPKEATGFPFFKNMKNGKTHSGLPQSVSQLYEVLGYSESYRPNTRRVSPQFREHFHVFTNWEHGVL